MQILLKSTWISCIKPMNAYNEFLDKCHKTNLNKILEIGLYYDFQYNRIICTTKKELKILISKLSPPKLHEIKRNIGANTLKLQIYSDPNAFFCQNNTEISKSFSTKYKFKTHPKISKKN